MDDDSFMCYPSGSTRRRPTVRTGFIIGLVGAAAAFAGTFVPNISGSFNSSNFSVNVWSGGLPLTLRLAGLVSLYGGVAIMVGLSVAGLRRAHPERWALALAGTAGVILIRPLVSVITDKGFATFPGTKVTTAGVTLGVIGGVVAMVRSREEASSSGPIPVEEPSAFEGATESEGRAPSILGAVLVLVGATIYVLATFLPYWSFDQYGVRYAPSTAHDLTIRGFFMLYGPAILVAAVAIGYLRTGGEPRWGVTLAAASAAWGLSGAPTLFLIVPFVPGATTHAMAGYWGNILGPTVALAAGVIVAERGRRRRMADRAIVEAVR